MKFLFIIDPIEEFNINRDSSFATMLEAQKRGYEVWYTQTQDIWAEKNLVFSNAIKVKLQRGNQHYENLEQSKIDLTSFDCIFMRKDPPFNMEYVYSTYLLSMVKDKVLVLNDPDSVRSSNEKVFILNFPTAIIDTIVTKNKKIILEFLSNCGGKAVIKPLDRKGGEGIFLLNQGDKNLQSIIDNSTEYEKTTVMVQKYIPEASLGDKRIILINGEPKGAFLRVPSEYDYRGNLCAGATAEKTEITPREYELCNIIGSKLKAMGLVFVGIDILGNYISEINVTSPTGFQEIARLTGKKIEEDLIDFVEQNLK